ncbi:MAG: hypothetical protein GX030_00450 [Firmicutes bacterium]|nr:hypothetical protein [Bacillota bacterium]
MEQIPSPETKQPIEVLVFGSPNAKYCASCGGSRSQAQIAQGLFLRLRRLFGEQVACRFVDVELEDLSAYPNVRRRMTRLSNLPIVTMDGEIQSIGHVYPNRLSHAIKKKLG